MYKIKSKKYSTNGNTVWIMQDGHTYTKNENKAGVFEFETILSNNFFNKSQLNVIIEIKYYGVLLWKRLNYVKCILKRWKK